MKIRIQHIIPALLLLVFATQCKDAYNPPVPDFKSNYLVVEGVIANDTDTYFNLSRTAKMDDTAVIKPETGATVTVEGSNNSAVQLIERGRGEYVPTVPMQLLTGINYRVRIRTSDNKEYLSAFEEARFNPAIDSIHWRWDKGEGIKILVDTHAPDNNSRYYRWAYEETWQHNATAYSVLKFNKEDSSVSERMPSEMLPLNCWKSDESTSIILASTAKLTQDVVAGKQVAFIPEKSWKASVRYSILVKQYTMNAKAMDYWLMMQRNTESLGSIFDPQPSEARGNITSVSTPEEMVIGYVSVGNVNRKRIYIDRSELSNWGYSLACEEVLVDNNADSLGAYFASDFYTPVVQDQLTMIVTGISPFCASCALMASPNKPLWWQ